MSKKRGCVLAVLAAIFFVLDAFSKYWVNTSLTSIYEAPPFYPFGGIGVFHNFFGIDFAINKANNTGGAWSLFSSFPKTLLSIRIVIALFLFSYMSFFNKERKRDIPLVLVLTGAAGNIVDAFLYGSVVDMFHFILWGYSFPIFNVADTLIFFGVISLFFQEFFKKKKSHGAEPSKN